MIPSSTAPPMAGQQVNPLLSPPFFLVAGINPSSPISAQTEQIDQLNTLLLQEIDANFAKFHQILTARVLPEIKRLAIANEPTREAATFWRSFFEAAAAVRVPVPGDVSALHTGETTVYTDESHPVAESSSYLASDSFTFRPGASSTPLPNRTSATAAGALTTPAEQSYDDSMESPFDRMERRLQDISLDDSRGGASDMPTPSLPSGYSLPPMRDYGDGSSGSHAHAPPALAVREPVHGTDDATPRAGRTRGPVGANPFASASSSAASWNGIADLRSTPLNVKTAKSQPPHGSLAAAAGVSEDDDDMVYAMSPPVTMKFNLPPVASAMYAAGRTPKKSGAPPTSAGGAALPTATPPRLSGTGADDASKVVDDLLEEISRGYVPSPRMATPAGLRRYSVMPTDLPGGSSSDSSARLLFQQPPVAPAAASNPFSAAQAAAPAVLPAAASPPAREQRIRRSLANTSYGSDIQDATSADAYRPIGDDEDNSSGEDDSFASEGDSALPPLAPHAGFEIDDESYVSNVGDMTGTGPGPAYDASFTRTGVAAEAPGADASVIFGRPQGAPAARDDLVLMRPDEMVTFHGGRLEDARLTDSPTKGAR